LQLGQTTKLGKRILFDELFNLLPLRLLVCFLLGKGVIQGILSLLVLLMQLANEAEVSRIGKRQEVKKVKGKRVRLSNIRRQISDIGRWLSDVGHQPSAVGCRNLVGASRSRTKDCI